MTSPDRRSFLASLAALAGGALAAAWSLPAAAQTPRARRRRRVRRRVRRRHRRRAVRRMVAGRPVWVVPVGLAAGWELVHEDRVVVVKEIRTVEKDGVRREVAVVAGADGKTEEVEILREDTAENRKELRGSVLADDDRTTPAVESEEDDEGERR